MANANILTQQDKLSQNQRRLIRFKRYQANWDGYGAAPIPDESVSRAMKFICCAKLSQQPEVYPAAWPIVQAEYDCQDGTYIEIEFFEDRNVLFVLYPDDSERNEAFNDMEKLVGEVNLLLIKHHN